MHSNPTHTHTKNAFTITAILAGELGKIIDFSYGSAIWRLKKDNRFPLWQCFLEISLEQCFLEIEEWQKNFSLGNFLEIEEN